MNYNIKIIFENEPVGIGSTILRGLHRLYYRAPDELLYFHFTNILYGSETKNIWSAYLYQPFESEKEYIKEQYNNRNVIEERGVFVNQQNPFLFCYGREQNNAKEFLNSTTVAKYRNCVSKYLAFKPDVLKKVEDFCALNFKNKRIVSLHKRGTDQFSNSGHAGEMSHLLGKDLLRNTLDKYLTTYDAIFLATDEEDTYSYLKTEYGDQLISYSTMRSQKGDTRGTHFGHITDTAENKHILGEEAIIDFLLMSRCSYSLCMRSNLSLLSILARQDFNYSFIDDHITYDRLG